MEEKHFFVVHSYIDDEAKKISQENRYDNFSAQVGKFPAKEYYNVTFPDYVTLTYDFNIWTTWSFYTNMLK